MPLRRNLLTLCGVVSVAQRIIKSGNSKTAIKIARVVIFLGLGWKLSPPVPLLYTHGRLLSTLLSCNPQQIHRFAHTSCHTSNSTGSLHCVKPLLLLWFYTPAGTFYLDARKYCYLLTHHLRCNGDATPANQIGAAFT